ncbi:MAG TPA: acyltransferase [Burkholderiaceae bacterium]
MTDPRSRNPGLDTLRAAAIALVFAYHYMVFVSGRATFGFASRIGWTGVDLFFVLSGYLIANQLLGGMARGDVPSLPRFYARRALRTLPVFWLVLAAYVLFPATLGGRTPPPLWRFLTFTQNIGLAPGTAFSHAWSLCVEEQFYLVLPLVLAVATALAGGRLGRRHGWWLMGALVALGVTARALLWPHWWREADAPGYMAWIYYATPCRFDEFVPGVAVAMLRNFHRPAWERLVARGGLVFALGTIATGGLLVLDDRAYYVEGVGWGWFMTVFGYSLLAMAFALLVVAALSPARTPLRWRVPGARTLALWSYSTYLSHKPLAFVLARALKPLALAAPTQAAAIALACVVAGGLLYRLVEAPFLALRDRLVPTSFRDAPAATAPGAALVSAAGGGSP